MPESLKKTEALPVGIVLERRRGLGPWQEFAWRPVAVIPGAPPVEGAWHPIREGDGWAQFHAATLPLELFHTDTAGYKLNLSQDPPRVWVVLRPDEAGEAGVAPFFVTASAHEAEAYQVSGTETVEPVPMPDALIALVSDFVEQHHVDVVFEKRERTRHAPDGAGRGRRPV